MNCQHILYCIHTISQISTSPRVECVNCHVAVAMDMMQEHDEVCGGGGSGNVANYSAR
jgi:hypothetical protein